MAAWAALLLTYTVGMVFSIGVACFGAVQALKHTVQAEMARPDFADLSDAGVWSRAGLRWYLRWRRERTGLLYGLLTGMGVAAPILVVRESEFTAAVAVIGGALLTEIGVLCCLNAVSRPVTDHRLVDFSLTGDQVSQAHRQRVTFDRVDYRLRCGATIAVGVLYMIAPRSSHLQAEPGVLTLVAVNASLYLPFVIVYLACRFWKRTFVVAHTLMALTDILRTEPDRDPQPTDAPPLRIADAGHLLRSRLARTARQLDDIGKRVTATSRPPARHPLPVIMWSAADEIRAFLRSPQSLTGRLTPRMRELTVALLVVLAGPADDAVYQTIVADPDAFDADWSARHGGFADRLSARIIAVSDQLEHVKRGVFALAVVGVIVTGAVLYMVGKVEFKDLAEIVAGFN
ncbi:hypothetical protein Q0Z83_042600 [Actinoplanes sichuanensis]|nr:hypothetical protein Q0Z83_042600 [Actinoplanes sichuanensis]